MPATAAALSGLCDRIVAKRRSAASSSPARSDDFSDSSPRCISIASEYGAARAYSCASDGTETADHQPPATSKAVNAAAQARRCLRGETGADGAGAAAADASVAAENSAEFDEDDSVCVGVCCISCVCCVCCICCVCAWCVCARWVYDASAVNAAIRTQASAIDDRRRSTLVAVIA